MTTTGSPVRRPISPLRLLEALATPHGVDRYLELVHPMLTVRDLRAEVTHVHRSTPDTVTLTLRPTRQWQGFRAGQFVQVSVLIDGVRRTRCFSPACSQHRRDGRIELTVKAHPGGLVSRYLHARAEPGLVVGLSQADGTFGLPADRPDKVVLISGGSGITPVLSMLRTLCDEGHAGDVTFLHYASAADDVSYREELHELAARHANVDLALVHTRRPVDGALHGHFSRAHLESVAPWYADAETFVCGPPGLTSAVRAYYEEQRLGEHLHTEQFQPEAPGADSDASGTVSFDRSGLSAQNSGDTLLVQAEAAGLRPPHGCRMGICFSCAQVKTSGCTRNIRTGETNSDADVEVQLCISQAVGDVALDI
ncbi:MAG: ferredoxin reductase [Jatrophihabitantaceae bacterium]